MDELGIERVFMTDIEKLSGVGFLHQMSVSETYKYHTHSFFEFFYVLKGRAIHHINGQKLSLSQGTLVFIRPDDAHQYSFINDFDMELLSLGVCSEHIEAACSYLGIPVAALSSPFMPLQVIFTGNDDWVMSKKLLHIGKTAIGQDRRQYFLSVLPELLYQVYHAPTDNMFLFPSWLSLLVEQMEKPSNFVKGLPRMLHLSGVSQEHLNRTFKKYIGLTPTAYINMKRVNYCAELLSEKQADILDACYKSGFNNVGYFYQVFRSVYHCTPKQFMKTDPKINIAENNLIYHEKMPANISYDHMAKS